MNKWMNNFKYWKFDKKMKIFISMSIIITTMVILIVSTVSFILIERNQSRQMAEEKLYSMAFDYEDDFSSYKELAIALVMDSTIQNYLLCDKSKKETYYSWANSARNTLLNATNVNSNINFISVINEESGDYIYKGDVTVYTSQFYSNYAKDYKNSHYMGLGTMRMSYNNIFSSDEEYTMNIYYPIYSTKKIGKTIGLLCINLKENNLEKIFGQEQTYNNSRINFIDQTGVIIAIEDKKLIGTKVDYIDQLGKANGSFVRSGQLYSYQKIGQWNYYLVQIIPTTELIKSSIRVAMILVFIIIIMVGICVYLSGELVAFAYRPLNNIVSKMEAVSNGQLEVRIKEEQAGEDFKKLALGFNSMMEEIDILMGQVKLEQKQLEQIRFNALQAQIKPHFLYNTLDCIHWQAISDGNQEVSTLVKALASYYRICLSKGKDIITLSQEISHIENYLIIQNMRYDNIIESQIHVEHRFLEVKIPKMTLQPLVENAIYHGIKIKGGMTGKVIIQAKQHNKDVIIEVIDSGTGMTENQIREMNNSISEVDETFGYGVRNVNKRIEIMFGKQYGLYFIKNEQNGVTVQIRLPYEI